MRKIQLFNNLENAIIDFCERIGIESGRKPIYVNNFINRRFGRLVVIDFLGYTIKNKRKQGVFSTKCDCGNYKIVYRSMLRELQTQSCGCLLIDRHIKSLNNNTPAFNVLFESYKIRAKKKEIVFELSKDDFKLLTQSNCFYCDIKPYQKNGNNLNCPYIYNGIDRINSDIGYIMKNCLSCCGICNKMKGSMTFQQFINKCGIINKRLKHIHIVTNENDIDSFLEIV